MVLPAWVQQVAYTCRKETGCVASPGYQIAPLLPHFELQLQQIQDHAQNDQDPVRILDHL
jgi:hypothetical protein